MIKIEKETAFTEEKTNLHPVETQSESVIINSGMTQFEVINALYDSQIFSKIRLTAGARLVLIALARHYNPANEDFFPSYNCISAHTGVSRKSVERAIKELVSANLITYRTQKVNRYRFTGHFFACVKMTPKHGQNDDYAHGQNDDRTKKEEKINNKVVFYKNSFSNSETAQNDGSNTPDAPALQVSQNQSDNKQKSKKMTAARAFSSINAQNEGADNVSAFRRSANTSNYFGANTYRPRQRDGFTYEQRQNDGHGGSRCVPSLEATQRYLAELEESRKSAIAPCDYEPEAAIAWYNSLNPILKTSNMAKKVAQKYGLC